MWLSYCKRCTCSNPDVGLFRFCVIHLCTMVYKVQHFETRNILCGHCVSNVFLVSWFRRKCMPLYVVPVFSRVCAHRTDWRNGKALGLYSASAFFESQSGYLLSWLVFRGFIQLLQTCRDTASIKPRPLPSTFQIIIHLSIHSTFRNLATEIIVKIITPDELYILCIVVILWDGNRTVTHFRIR